MPALTQNRAGYYADYLDLKRLLSIQKPLTPTKNHLRAHGDMLLIIVHQSSQLSRTEQSFEV